MSVPDTASLLPIYRQVSHRDFHGAAYQERVDELRSGPYVEFPSVVSIETLSLCNAACNFCPYPSLTRKGEAMSDELIEKILTDIEEIANRPPFEVTLSRVNEPFLDPRVLDISFDIEHRFPEATNMFTSNGTPLTEKTLLRLAELKRVAYLRVSLNEHRSKEYEAIMQLPFDKTIARLDLIHRMKSAGALKFPVYLSRVGDGSEADAEFLEWVKKTYPSLSGLVTVRGDWMGAVATATGPVPDIGCRQWFQLHFLSNGKSAFCCVDSDGRHGVGHAKTQHVIHEVYNDPTARNLRLKILSRLDVAACQNCAMLP